MRNQALLNLLSAEEEKEEVQELPAVMVKVSERLSDGTTTKSAILKSSDESKQSLLTFSSDKVAEERLGRLYNFSVDNDRSSTIIQSIGFI